MVNARDKVVRKGSGEGGRIVFYFIFLFHIMYPDPTNFIVHLPFTLAAPSHKQN